MSLSTREKSFELLLKKIIRHGIKEAVQNKNTFITEEEDSKEKDSKEASVEPEAPIKADAAALVDLESLNLNVLKDELNTMRSGKSVDNVVVTQELEKYYNGLSPQERMTMYTYLNALAKILTGEVSAADAPDPSEVPDTTSGPKDEPEKKLSDVVKKPKPAEDMAPPVKVSGKTENAANESFRKFIKTLLTEEL